MKHENNKTDGFLAGKNIPATSHYHMNQLTHDYLKEIQRQKYNHLQKQCATVKI